MIEDKEYTEESGKFPNREMLEEYLFWKQWYKTKIQTPQKELSEEDKKLWIKIRDERN